MRVCLAASLGRRHVRGLCLKSGRKFEAICSKPEAKAGDLTSRSRQTNRSNIGIATQNVGSSKCTRPKTAAPATPPCNTLGELGALMRLYGTVRGHEMDGR